MLNEQVSEEVASMSNDTQDDKKSGNIYAAGSMLGVGIGAAVGYSIGDLGNGVWVGAVIGVGLAMLYNTLR